MGMDIIQGFEQTASTIAYNIDNDSCFQFTKIFFQNLVKQAHAKLLLNFIAEHIHLSIKISRHLQEFSNKVSKYAQV